jgi:hypothetical protein
VPNGPADQLPVETMMTSTKGAYSFTGLGQGAYTMWFAPTATTYAQYYGDTTNIDDNEWVNVYPSGGGASYADAVLAASGSISGKVSKLPSGALGGYTVNAWSKAPDDTWSIDASAKTNSSGSYTVTGLEPGKYSLEAIDETSTHPTYSPTFSGGATKVEDAMTVGVVANKTSSYGFTLGKAGSVSGTVTGL